jgi:hypothetical protein
MFRVVAFGLGLFKIKIDLRLFKKFGPSQGALKFVKIYNKKYYVSLVKINLEPFFRYFP